MADPMDVDLPEVPATISAAIERPDVEMMDVDDLSEELKTYSWLEHSSYAGPDDPEPLETVHTSVVEKPRYSVLPRTFDEGSFNSRRTLDQQPPQPLKTAQISDVQNPWYSALSRTYEEGSFNARHSFNQRLPQLSETAHTPNEGNPWYSRLPRTYEEGSFNSRHLLNQRPPQTPIARRSRNTFTVPDASSDVGTPNPSPPRRFNPTLTPGPRGIKELVINRNRGPTIFGPGPPPPTRIAPAPIAAPTPTQAGPSSLRPQQGDFSPFHVPGAYPRKRRHEEVDPEEEPLQGHEQAPQPGTTMGNRFKRRCIWAYNTLLSLVRRRPQSQTAPVVTDHNVPVDPSETAPVDSDHNVPVDSSPTAPVVADRNVPVNSSPTAPGVANRNVPVDSSPTAPVVADHNVPVDSSTAVPREAQVILQSDTPQIQRREPEIIIIQQSEYQEIHEPEHLAIQEKERHDAQQEQPEETQGGDSQPVAVPVLAKPPEWQWSYPRHIMFELSQRDRRNDILLPRYLHKHQLDARWFATYEIPECDNPVGRPLRPELFHPKSRRLIENLLEIQADIEKKARLEEERRLERVERRKRREARKKLLEEELRLTEQQRAEVMVEHDCNGTTAKNANINDGVENLSFVATKTGGAVDTANIIENDAENVARVAVDTANTIDHGVEKPSCVAVDTIDHGVEKPSYVAVDNANTIDHGVENVACIAINIADTIDHGAEEPSCVAVDTANTIDHGVENVACVADIINASDSTRVENMTEVAIHTARTIDHGVEEPSCVAVDTANTIDHGVEDVACVADTVNASDSTRVENMAEVAIHTAHTIDHGVEEPSCVAVDTANTTDHGVENVACVAIDTANTSKSTDIENMAGVAVKPGETVHTVNTTDETIIDNIPDIAVQSVEIVDAVNSIPSVSQDNFALSPNSRRVSQIQDKKEKRRQAAEARKKARLEAEERAKAEKARKEAERKALLEQPNRKIPVERVITELSPEWNAKVDQAMRSAPGKELAWTSTGQPLTKKDFDSLVPPKNSSAAPWLNDEIINAYLTAVVDYGLDKANARENGNQRQTRARDRTGTAPRYHAFNSFFYTNLRNKGPSSVSRWLKKAHMDGKNLLNVDHIFIPVNQSSHWTLIVLSPSARRIEYFDSLGGSKTQFIANVKGLLKAELKGAYKEKEWKVENTKSPVQQNSFDCGVFTVTTAKMIMMGIDPMAYSQRDIPMQRRRMAAELMNGGFHGDFAPKVEL